MGKARLSGCASYANVMATLAVFIALGGTGYAMSQISGSQIKNGSISAQKLKSHTLTADQIENGSLLGQDLAPHTVSSNELRDLVVSARRHNAKARVAQAATAPATIIKVSVGQSAAIVQSGPFTYTLDCTADSSGHPLASIQAQSSEPGSLIDAAFDSSGHPIFGPVTLTPGQPVYVVAPTDSTAGTEFGHLINGAYMIAPSGAALIVNISYGTALFGAACWATGFGVS